MCPAASQGERGLIYLRRLHLVARPVCPLHILVPPDLLILTHRRAVSWCSAYLQTFSVLLLTLSTTMYMLSHDRIPILCHSKSR